jgi:hypothetical protein
MKATGLSFEHWDIVPSYIVRLEPDNPATRIVSGKFASTVIWIAVLPQYRGVTPPSEEWLNGVRDGSSSLEEWVSKVEDEPSQYLLHEGVKAIFKDAGIITHNGFPQAHIVGPAKLIEES